MRELPSFLGMARKGIRLIYASFAISFLYNAVGLAFAVTGHLSPLVAAILMPASSVSVVLFTTLGVRLIAWRASKAKTSPEINSQIRNIKPLTSMPERYPVDSEHQPVLGGNH